MNNETELARLRGIAVLHEQTKIKLAAAQKEITVLRARNLDLEVRVGNLAHTLDEIRRDPYALARNS